MSRIVRILSVVWLLLFVFAAVVQYNDPDPFLWIAIYGLAALACALYAFGRLPVLFGALLSGACLVGALYLLAPIIGPRAFFDDTGLQMMGLREVSREMLGLFLAAGWVGFMTWYTYRARRQERVGA